MLVAGSTVPKIGGIFENTVGADPGSPIQYLVDFDQKKIIFVSGVGAGYNIPGSTNAVTVNYQRSVPVNKRGRDVDSINLYGLKEKVIVDTNITDPQQAKLRVQNELALRSSPLRQGSLTLQGLALLNAGKTVVVNLPNHDVASLTFDILEVEYRFNARNNYHDQNMRVRVSKRIGNFLDTMKFVINSLKELQASDIGTNNVISRLETYHADVTLRLRRWEVTTQNLGESFILGHAINGVLGSPAASVTGSNVKLGDFRGAATVQASGGTYT